MSDGNIVKQTERYEFRKKLQILYTNKTEEE